MDCRVIFSTAFSILLIPVISEAQAPRPLQQRPLVEGRDVVVNDGDRVIIDADTSIRVVRRIRGVARAVYSQEHRWILIMVDLERAGQAPDGVVDVSYTLADVDGNWPLDPRWEGIVAIEENLFATDLPSEGILLTTASGVIRFAPFNTPGRREFPPSGQGANFVITFQGISRGSNGSRMPFDAAEQRLVQNANYQAGMRHQRVQSGVVLPGVASASTPGAGTGPMRVGGNVAAPKLIANEPPVYPEAARQANILGVVILEIDVGADGSVTNARILRSIPLLDQPALDAVRKWRYEPTLVNGVAVAVRMTVTVNFQ
jgi:TonB family protein